MKKLCLLIFCAAILFTLSSCDELLGLPEGTVDGVLGSLPEIPGLPSNPGDSELPDFPEAEDGHKHIPSEAIIEDKIDSTCESDGSYTAIINCTICGEELIRQTITTPKAEHTPKDAVIENEKAGSCKADGSYDSVVYCDVCDCEISRETVNTGKETDYGQRWKT